jgi:subtilase family serine protease
MPAVLGGLPQWMIEHQAVATCPQVAHKPTCLVLRIVKKGVPPPCSPSKGCGFTATQLEAAYGISKDLRKGSGTTVALIENGNYDNASSDLSVYRTEYGLGTVNLAVYNAHGQKYDYPQSCEDYGWCLETALDMDMVSASCPKCNIVVLEAADDISSLEEAESTAVTLGATIVSNSWICYGEWDCGDTNFPNYFDARGVAYLAASGDEGYGELGGPSVLDSVIAVGGTQLQADGSKYDNLIWKDTGYGCATGVSKPSWQHEPDCSYRIEDDVSAEAGCTPGVAEYTSYYGGWTGVCGTSVAAPFTAGVIALAGNASSWDANGGKRFWIETTREHEKYFGHPSCGSDSCGCEKQYKKYYCADGGWGTPNGIKGY